MSSVLECRKLRFSYAPDQPIFDGLSIAVDEGQVIALCGRSGVGKTTLTLLLGGHLQPASGEVRVLGKKVDGPSSERPIVFQNHNLFPWLSAEENVAFGLRCRHERRTARLAKARALLERMGLGKAVQKRPHELSGGMQQRVGIARALAVEPTCILMDEPFSALDEETKDTIAADIKTIATKNGVMVVLVTHDRNGLDGLADKIVTILGPGSVEITSRPRVGHAEDGRLVSGDAGGH